jgi:hypothetical protein
MDILKARKILNLKNLMNIDITPFIPIQSSLMGLGSPRFYAMMNALAGCLEKDEHYLEIGVYHGASAVATLVNNNSRGFLVDNFETNFSITQLEENLKRFNILDRVNIFNMDSKRFFAIGSVENVKIGLYYYDASHTMESTTLCLSLGFPHVVKGGFIVIDDIAWKEVSVGINKFIATFPGKLSIIFATNPNIIPEPTDEDWWAGTIVLQKI